MNLYSANTKKKTNCNVLRPWEHMEAIVQRTEHYFFFAALGAALFRICSIHFVCRSFRNTVNFGATFFHGICLLEYARFC